VIEHMHTPKQLCCLGCGVVVYCCCLHVSVSAQIKPGARVCDSTAICHSTTKLLSIMHGFKVWRGAAACHDAPEAVVVD
jgi:hypothetical protein